MPLIKSASKAAVSRNIETERAAGKKQSQAVAIALNIARKARANGGKVHVGPLKGATGGRADAVKTKVPDGSHVIAADAVSALGGGNTAAGHMVLQKIFPQSSINTKQSKSFGKKFPKQLASGGAVPVKLSDGEFTVSPADVLKVGDGDADRGHALLDEFQMQVRKQNIHNLQHLPGPEND